MSQSVQTTVNSGTLALSGGEVDYHLEGDGRCVTFVCTNFEPSAIWRSFSRRIVADHRLLMYDLREAKNPPPFDQQAGVLAEMLDALEIDTTHLISPGCGALICRDFGVQFPARTDSLVFTAPVFNPWNSQRQVRLLRLWLDALESGGMKQLFRNMYPVLFGDRLQGEGYAGSGPGATYWGLREGFLSMNSPEGVRAHIMDVIAYLENAAPDSELFPLISAPTLLLIGDDDSMLSPTGVRAVADFMPDAQVEVFDGCGHAIFLEDTDRFESSVCAFIKAVEEA